MRRNPGFSLVALLTLALAIGANSAIFSFVDGVLLRPLPYDHPERIVSIDERSPDGMKNGAVSTLNFFDWRSQSRSFAAIAGVRRTNMTLSRAGEPMLLTRSSVSWPARHSIAASRNCGGRLRSRLTSARATFIGSR